jgi:hypothetical protein
MRTRCNNPKSKDYPNYGGRGITICERWNDFASFLTDMGLKPTPAHEIDRIDNDGHYEPGNCRWVLPVINSNNKRNSHFLTIDGRTQTLMQWACEANIHPTTLRERIKRGWHPDWLLVPFPGMAFYER